MFAKDLISIQRISKFALQRSLQISAPKQKIMAFNIHIFNIFVPTHSIFHFFKNDTNFYSPTKKTNWNELDKERTMPLLPQNIV